MSRNYLRSDAARHAEFDTRLDQYRARHRNFPAEAEDVYQDDVPTPEWYREMRDEPHPSERLECEQP